MLFLAHSIVPLAFAFLVVYGALSDLSTFRIPNWISYGLVGLFVMQSIVYWLSVTPGGGFWPGFATSLGIGLFVLIVSVIFWARGHIGGGDVKYLSATSLFMGPEGIMQFMVLLSAFALAMALFLKLSKNWGFLVNAGKLPTFVKRIYGKLEVNQLPYGFPIGIAALVMIPHAFRL